MERAIFLQAWYFSSRDTRDRVTTVIEYFVFYLSDVFLNALNGSFIFYKM